MESSLTIVELTIYVRASSEALHSSMPIFRLQEKSQEDYLRRISKITMQRYEEYFWHCPDLSIFVHFCPFFLNRIVVNIRKNL